MANDESKKAAPVVLHKLKQSRLEMGESRIRYWFAMPEEGTPYKMLFDPIYWDIHAHQFAPWDFIRVIPDEKSYIAELVVTGTGIGGVRITEVWKKELSTGEAPADLLSMYRVHHAGPYHKWRVERREDKHIEQYGFETEKEAQEWLAANFKALGRPKAA
jgi:hypothetical protein